MYIETCPHCGGESTLTANYSYKTRSYFVFVKCNLCGAQGKSYVSPQDPNEVTWDNEACNHAIAAWNKRTPIKDNN